MQEKMPSSPGSLHPSDDLPRTLSWKMCPDSQTRLQQIPGGKASITGDQIWGTLRASPGTHFPDSLQKPLLAHVDPMQRHNGRIATSSINNPCRKWGLQGSISAESAQHRHTNTSKSGPLPFPHQHPNVWSALLNFYAEVPMRLCPTKHARKDAGVHPIQKDGLKHSSNKPVDMHT